MNNLRTKIEDKLKKEEIAHTFIPLPEDLAGDIDSHVKFHGIQHKQAVPTIIYKTEKGLIAVQRRADTKFDLEKLKNFLAVKTLVFASNHDLRQLGTEAGIVPLTGLNIPYYIDQKVLEVKEIFGGVGDRLFALKINSRDLMIVNKALVGDFAVIEEQSQVINSKIQVYSGTRATGRLHLGNYLGAVKGYIELQQKYSCVYSVVDLHAITTPYDKEKLSDDTLNVIMDYLAAGLDPQKSLIEVQSLVPQHTELAYYLGTLYPVARLEDLPTYKEKKDQFPKYVNIGLLYYPVLMAADILLYKASLVPVGVDQEPHLEVTREIARNFNREYGLTFPEAKRFATRGEYVPSLTGEGKMSKTKEGSFINLVDSKEVINQKIAKIPTDAGGPGKFPSSGPVANLIKLVDLFEGRKQAEMYKNDYETKGVRYKDIKIKLTEAIYEELKPIQERRKKLEEDPQKVKDLLFDHAKKLKALAQDTVDETKDKMGFFK